MRSLTVVVIAVALALAGCGGGGGGDKAPVSLSGKVTNKGVVKVSGTTVTVKASDFAFTPTYVEAAPNTHLTITVSNVGSSTHSFTIDSAHVDRTLTAGKSTTVSVTVPASGSLNFFCKFHRGLGMQGAIVAKS